MIDILESLGYKRTTFEQWMKMPKEIKVCSCGKEFKTTCGRPICSDCMKKKK
jgi:hypothetical protein